MYTFLLFPKYKASVLRIHKHLVKSSLTITSQFSGEVGKNEERMEKRRRTGKITLARQITSLYMSET